MNTLTKTLVGTVAAGAMAVSTVTPAIARDNNDGIGAGEVIAGALIIGGIAAIAAAASDKDHDNYGYGDRYDRHGKRGYRYDGAGYYRMGSRDVVQRCVSAAQSNASRYSHGRADVTEIRDIVRKRNGYDVKGTIVVDGRRGWSHHRYDSGRFTCKVRYGRIADLDFSGIRGLR